MQKLRTGYLVAAASAAALLAAGCGSSNNSGTGTNASSTTGTQTSQSSSASDFVAQSAGVVKQAESGYVTSLNPGYTPLADLKAVTSYQGAPITPLPKDKKVTFVNCLNLPSSCTDYTDAAINIAKSANWQTKTLAGDLTGPSYVTAYNSALAAKPNAIVGTAIAPLLVQQQLAQAKSAGTKTVFAYEDPRAGAGADAYVSVLTNIQNELLAAKMIAAQNGHVVAAIPTFASAPALDPGAFVKSFEGCTTCKIYTPPMNQADLASPAKTFAFTSSLIAKYPDLQYIVLASDAVPLGPYQRAIESRGRTGKTFLVFPNATATGAKLVKSGAAPFAAYVSPTWMAYAGNDATAKVMTGVKPAGAFAWGVGASILTKDNLASVSDPTIANLDAVFSKAYDFKAPYEKVWGTTS